MCKTTNPASSVPANGDPADRILFELDAEQFRLFLAFLDTPRGPNPGLERLKAVKAPWNKKRETATP